MSRFLDELREVAQGDEMFGFDGMRGEPDPMLTECARRLEVAQRLALVLTMWQTGCATLPGYISEDFAEELKATAAALAEWKALK